jgi:hypothetical protein
MTRFSDEAHQRWYAQTVPLLDELIDMVDRAREQEALLSPAEREEKARSAAMVEERSTQERLAEHEKFVDIREDYLENDHLRVVQSKRLRQDLRDKD